MSEIPRRSSTLFEKSGATVRRLARRISLSVLNRDRDSSRSSSVATLRRDSSDSTVTPAPERPRSRISRWRSNGTSHGSNVSSLMPPSVIEEPSEDAILRSATPRGFDGGKKQVNRVAVQLPWAVPKARVFRHGRTGGQVEYDVSPLVYGRKVCCCCCCCCCARANDVHRSTSFGFPPATRSSTSVLNQNLTDILPRSNSHPRRCAESRSSLLPRCPSAGRNTAPPIASCSPPRLRALSCISRHGKRI